MHSFRFDCQGGFVVRGPSSVTTSLPIVVGTKIVFFEAKSSEVGKKIPSFRVPMWRRSSRVLTDVSSPGSIEDDVIRSLNQAESQSDRKVHRIEDLIRLRKIP